MYSTGVGKNKMIDKKSLKIPKGSSEYAYHRRTYSTIAKRNNAKGQTTSTKHTHKTIDRVTRTPLKTGDKLRCSGRVGSSRSRNITSLLE
jgi:hypothetical protein